MTTSGKNRLDKFARRLVRAKARASRTVDEARGTFLEVTVNPFICRFATDVVLAAEFRNREHLSEVVSDKLSLKVHG